MRIVQSFRSRILLGALLCLAVGSGVLQATMTPSVWVSHQMIGLTENGWLAWRTTRQIQSYYSYSVKSVLVEINQANGCGTVHGEDKETDWHDSEANGNWSRSAPAVDGDASMAMPGQLTPALPSGWRSQFASNDDGLVLDYFGVQRLLYTRAALTGWAKVQGVVLADPVHVAGVLEPVHGWRGDGMVYVTLETAERDIDIDYARFIVPVNLAAVIANQEAESTNRRKGPLHGPPTGC